MPSSDREQPGDGERREASRRPASESEREGEGEAPGERRAAEGVDPRFLSAWKQWLAALATDAEAALAAAQVYEALDGAGRDALLDAIDEDAPRLGVPRVALYAPLAAVEREAPRARRIASAMCEPGGAPVLPSFPSRAPHPGLRCALRAALPGGVRIAVLVAPLYLRFVRVLCCRYDQAGFESVSLAPLLRDEEAPTHGARLGGAVLERTPVKLVVEELAHAVLAHRRRGAELPAALRAFPDLFDAGLDGDAPDEASGAPEAPGGTEPGGTEPESEPPDEPE